jgi:hypothetical protein
MTADAGPAAARAAGPSLAAGSLEVRLQNVAGI